MDILYLMFHYYPLLERERERERERDRETERERERERESEKQRERECMDSLECYGFCGF